MKALVFYNDGKLMRVIAENGRGYRMDGLSTGAGKDFQVGEIIFLEFYRNAIVTARVESELILAKVIIDQGIADTEICLRCGKDLVDGEDQGYCASCLFFYAMEEQK